MTFRRLTILFFLSLLLVHLLSFFQISSIGIFLADHRTVIYFMLIVLYFGISFMMAFIPCSGFHHLVHCRGTTGEPWVALTFDDGPDPLHTPQVLRILEKHQATATFFLVGSRALANETLVKEIVKHGHTVGNHSLNHSVWFDFYTPAMMEKELKSTGEAIAAITGLKPLWFRPPFGVVNPMLSRAMKRCSLTAIGWSIRSFDTVSRHQDKALHKITRALKPGSVILLHDHTVFTAEKLDMLIHDIRKQGYAIQPLEKVINLPPYA